MVNSLIDALNRRDQLPHFLIFAMDSDLFQDVDLYSDDTIQMNSAAVQWVVWQTAMLIRRKRTDLLDKKPGTVYTGDPITIFVRMIR